MMNVGAVRAADKFSYHAIFLKILLQSPSSPSPAWCRSCDRGMLLPSATLQFVSQTTCRRNRNSILSEWRRNISRTNYPNLTPQYVVYGRKFKSTVASSPIKADGNEEKPSESGSQQNAKEGEKQNQLRLRFLPRPLGVSEPPRTTQLTWEERKANFLDYDKHLEERRHLMKELATKGYWTDMTRLSDFGGKMWIGAPALIKDSASLYFPDVEGTTLNPKVTVHTTDLCKDHVSIIAILTTLLSESHVKSFVEPVLKEYDSNPNFRYIQINLQENRLKSILVSMLINRLKGNVPEKYHSTYMLSHQNMEYVREDLGLLNKHIGFVYLVDENVKVRWAGCAFARDEERTSLRGCTGELLARLKKEEKN